MRVLLADDQREVRSALKLLLEQEPTLSVVGEVSGVEALLAQVEVQHPDLLLLDWELPGLTVRGSPSQNSANGASTALLTILHTRYPALCVIVLSGRPEARPAALAAGANAFVSKGDPPERLLDAVRRQGPHHPSEV